MKFVLPQYSYRIWYGMCIRKILLYTSPGITGPCNMSWRFLTCAEKGWNGYVWLRVHDDSIVQCPAIHAHIDGSAVAQAKKPERQWVLCGLWYKTIFFQGLKHVTTIKQYNQYLFWGWILLLFFCLCWSILGERPGFAYHCLEGVQFALHKADFHWFSWYLPLCILYLDDRTGFKWILDMPQFNFVPGLIQDSIPIL